MSFTHVAFSDESYTKARHRSIALVTQASEDLGTVNSEIATLLSESGVSEFKWLKLRTAKMRFAAAKLINWTISRATQKKLRVDILIWDLEDSRHKNVLGRDDNENFERMYYHLLANVLGQRWPNGSTWKLYPDQNSIVDWPNLKSILNTVGQGASHGRNQPPLPLIGDLASFGVTDIEEVDSCQAALCQIADLFAGLGAFSHEKFEIYRNWCQRDQPRLPGLEDGSVSFTRSDNERCTVLNEFNTECKNYSLGVSLNSSSGLCTRNPNYPLNFWLYQPQRSIDKAPTKVGDRHKVI